MKSEGRARRPAGFTLLEVLVAVAVLGILYTTLAGVAIQGLQAEGAAERRLRASLLADRAVHEIESQAALGSAPAVGREESQADEFLVVLDVTPLELTLPTPETPVGAGTIPGTQAADTGSILGATDPRGQPALRKVDVTVAWQEGFSERAVRRTTYAFDRLVVAELLEGLAVPGSELATGPEREETIDDAVGETQQ